MFRRLLVAGLAMAAIGLTSSAYAQDRWVLLGTKNVNDGGGTDSIDLLSAKGTVKAIRLITPRRGAEISKVELVYGNGRSHIEERPMNMNPGDRTRSIDAKGDERFVDRVNLTYKAKPGNNPLVVEVHGLQSADGGRAVRPVTQPGAAPQAAAPPVAAPPAAGVTGQVPVTPTQPKAAPVQPGQQTDTGDVLFGSQYVGFGVDRDVIKVGADIGKFDRVRMRVLDNDIFINSMKVVYANGDVEEVAYNAEVKKDSRTRWIQLKGDRFIKEIQLNYRSRPNFRGQAYLEVYGQYAEGWLAPKGPGKEFNKGWVLLGAQTAGFTIDRNDVVSVPKNEGGFQKIRVNVRDQAITLFELRVVYGNGDVDILPANRTKVDSGASYGPIDLKGGTRVIKEIRPTYRTRVFQQGGVARGRAVVEFWAQH
jgi:hypothetical protein